MTNNDILRRLRFCLNYNDAKMIEVYRAADVGTISSASLSSWLQKEEHENYKSLSDKDFSIFLTGLINVLRGKKQGAPAPIEVSLNNNVILRKIKIALNLQSNEIIEILALADFRFSEHELSALFRKPEHKHFRLCKDQVLRNFLMGLQKRLRAK
jgi:uncharacterized protein YehS (DUF1456 family)